jgi:hypothetical protein
MKGSSAAQGGPLKSKPTLFGIFMRNNVGFFFPVARRKNGDRLGRCGPERKAGELIPQ